MNRIKGPIASIIAELKGEATLHDRQILSFWLRDKSNFALYDQIESVWRQVQTDSAEDEFDTDSHWAKLKARIESVPKERTIPLARVKRFGIVAAIVVPIMLLSTIYFTKMLTSITVLPQTYCSINGKSRVELPDGSIVTLNVNSKLSYNNNYGKESREVELQGEAMFEVVHDSKKKFRVKTQNIAVDVYGTRFDLCSYPEGKDITVTLLDGSISFISPKEQFMLRPGDKAIFSKNSGCTQIMSIDIEYASLWTKHEIHINGKSLRELSRYFESMYNVKVRICPYMPSNQKYTFTIRDESLEDILQLISRIDPINYYIDDHNTLCITK